MNTPETPNSWNIYRLLPNFQRLPVAQFRSRSEAESSLKVIRKLLPNSEFILAFEVGVENPTNELIQSPAQEPNFSTSVNRELLKIFIISSRLLFPASFILFTAIILPALLTGVRLSQLKILEK